MNQLRILVADDHEIVRRGICELLKAHTGWQICGQAADGRAAVEQVNQLRPDIVILDIGMPNLNGIDAARQMRESKYSDIRKFYACLRAAEAAKAAAGKNNPHTPREVHEFRKAAADYLTSVVQDGTIPGGEIYDACFQLLDASRLNPTEHEAFFNALEPHLVKNWPQEASLYLLRGNYYIDYAWHARGNAVASRVTASSGCWISLPVCPLRLPMRAMGGVEQAVESARAC